MRSTIIIAGSAVVEHSRRKLLLFFFAFSVLITAGLILIAMTTEMQDLLAGTPMGVLANGILGTFVTIATLAVSMGNIGDQFASGQALAILARPVARWQFALGRLAGSIAVVVGLCGVIAAELSITAAIAAEGGYADIWETWGITAFNHAVLATITTLFSVGIAQAIVTAILAFIVQSAIGIVESVRVFLKSFGVGGPLAAAADVLYYILPKFMVTPFDRTAARSQPLPGQLEELLVQPWYMWLWASGYLLAMVAVILLLVGRKEVK